uniref:Putative ovule protein n=1 Tax=Solanum chacoense TaxID=4108 RepID=A0A0V0GLL8_SOLCH
MWRLLVSVRQNLQNMGKSPRVADENMTNICRGENNRSTRQHNWTGFSIICGVFRAPLALFSCLNHPRLNGTDGVWVSGEFSQISEMNHLMVSDSMRYAILM